MKRRTVAVVLLFLTPALGSCADSEKLSKSDESAVEQFGKDVAEYRSVLQSAGEVATGSAKQNSKTPQEFIERLEPKVKRLDQITSGSVTLSSEWRTANSSGWRLPSYRLCPGRPAP